MDIRPLLKFCNETDKNYTDLFKRTAPTLEEVSKFIIDIISRHVTENQETYKVFSCSVNDEEEESLKEYLKFYAEKDIESFVYQNYGIYITIKRQTYQNCYWGYLINVNLSKHFNEVSMEVSL